jgi:hypothetical protein
VLMLCGWLKVAKDQRRSICTRMIASMAVKKKLGRWMDAAGKVNLSLSFACVQAGEIQM